MSHAELDHYTIEAALSALLYASKGEVAPLGPSLQYEAAYREIVRYSTTVALKSRVY